MSVLYLIFSHFGFMCVCKCGVSVLDCRVCVLFFGLFCSVRSVRFVFTPWKIMRVHLNWLNCVYVEIFCGKTKMPIIRFFERNYTWLLYQNRKDVDEWIKEKKVVIFILIRSVYNGISAKQNNTETYIDNRLE